MRRLFLLLIVALGPHSLLYAQSATPSGSVPLPEAIYTPRPIYRPEWAQQRLSGKGVVLVTIDTTTGKVSGARMAQSTGNKLLDGAALEAYSQWRFKPGSVPQVKIPIEFRPGSPGQVSKPKIPQRTILSSFLILLAVAALVMAISRRSRT